MGQSLVKLNAHLVFSTKNRERWLDAQLRDELFCYMSGILRNLDCRFPLVGGTEDHVHVLCALSKNHAPVKIVADLKRDSAKWLKQRSAEHKAFAWQRGYGLFSIGQSQVQDVDRYIRGQEEHHKKMTFKEELMALLEKYKEEFDPRYIWE